MQETSLVEVRGEDGGLPCRDGFLLCTQAIDVSNEHDTCYMSLGAG